MTIHEPTLMLVLGLASLAASALFFALAANARGVPGLRCWGAGSLAGGFAILLDAPRLVGDWQLASLLFNIPFSAAQALLLAGAMQFCGVPGATRAWAVLTGVAALVTLLFTFVVPDSGWRIGALSLYQALVNGATAAILWRSAVPRMRLAYQVAAGAAMLQSLSAAAQGALAATSTVALTYAAPQLPLANILSWAGVTLNVLVGNAMLFLLIMLRLSGELRHAAERDLLTGLLNRRGLRPRVDRILRGPRDGSVLLAVLLIDIDHFKRVNDRHGHEAGDQVLAAMGAVLLALPAPHATPCRWGGEEFCVVLQGLAPEAVQGLAEQVRRRFARASAALPELDGGATASIGIALARLDGRFEMAALVRAADAALYRAKEAGRDRVAVDSGAR